MRRWLPIGAITLGFAGACTSFGSSGDDAPAPRDVDAGGPRADARADLDGAPQPIPGEGGVVPGGETDADADAAVAVLDAGSQNLLRNGGFEDFAAAGADCGGWSASPGAATFTLDDATHEGAYACKVCFGASSASYTIYSPEVSAAPGEYRGSSWLLRDGDSTTPSAADLVLQVNKTGTINSHRGFNRPNKWEERTADHTIDSGERLRIALRFDNFFTDGGPPLSSGTCILLDDVSIMKTP